MRVELPQGLPLIPGDAVLLEQVLSNLLENAVKYRRGALEIRANTRPAEALVEVNDGGAGVPIGEEERISTSFIAPHERERVKALGSVSPFVARSSQLMR